MNMQTAQSQRISALLSQVATVAAVKASALGLTRTDKQASAESERDHNAMRGIARVAVSRLAGAETRIKEIRSIQAQARDVLGSHTTAWGDRRLLPNVNIELFLKAWGGVKADFDRLVLALASDAPQLVAAAETNLGDFQVEPPTVEEIQNAFSLEFTLEPIADTSNYTSTLDKTMEDKLKERFEVDMQAAYLAAQRDALTRLAEPLQAAIDRLALYDKREHSKANGIDVGREGYFRDSLVTNITQIAAVFDSFNLTGDPVLKKISDQLDAFSGIEAEDLRNSKELRADTSRRAKAILDQLGDWL